MKARRIEGWGRALVLAALVLTAGFALAASTVAQTPVVDYDLTFIDSMVVHHNAAIAMAQEALQKAKRPELIALAKEIIAAQDKEVKRMLAWRDAWYPGAPARPSPMPGMGH